MNVPYMRPTLPPFDSLRDELERIISSGQLTKGPVVARYEQALAERLGVANVVATSSCTIGLALVFKALDVAGPVIVPSYTFMATAHALVWAGGTPVFVDIDPETWTIDPAAIEAALTPDVTAIVGVPVFGSPCAVEEIERIGASAGIPVVFDSAHGVGSSYGGSPLGRFGHAEVFSTTPTKTLVTGEGGFVTTDDDELARRLRLLIEYGNDGSFDTWRPGLNGRLPELSAALGVAMLDVLDGQLARRFAIVERYRAGLSPLRGVGLQAVRDGCVSSYKDFTIMVTDEAAVGRDELAQRLHDEGIDTKRYFYPAVHRHGPYRHLGYEGKLPVTERLELQALSLPLWSGMGDDQVEHVISTIAAILG